MSGPVWDWQFVIEIIPQLLQGLKITIAATLVGFAIAAVLGLIMALGRRSEKKWIAWPTTAVIEFIRMTPLLVQLFFMFYVLPRYGIRLPAFVVGVIGLGLHYGSYNSEVYRAGIDAIGRGQWEAARALNFSAADTWRRIILPQAIPPMYPALGNYLVAMFKESSLLLAISVAELMRQARVIGTDSFRFVEPMTMAGFFYFLLSYPSSLIVRKLEARYARKG